MQQVTEGRTMAGGFGLFTGGVMAWRINDGVWSRLDSRSWHDLTWEQKVEGAARLGFALVQKGE